MLYEAAQILLVRSAKWSWLKAWAMKIAMARRLAVIMHRMWVDGTEFRDQGSRSGLRFNAGSNAIGGNSSSTARWNDAPRGTMDEVSSYVRLDLPNS
jgi:hypothetical protein